MIYTLEILRLPALEELSIWRSERVQMVLEENMLKAFIKNNQNCCALKKIHFHGRLHADLLLAFLAEVPTVTKLCVNRSRIPIDHAFWDDLAKDEGLLPNLAELKIGTENMEDYNVWRYLPQAAEIRPLKSLSITFGSKKFKQEVSRAELSWIGELETKRVRVGLFQYNKKSRDIFEITN